MDIKLKFLPDSPLLIAVSPVLKGEINEEAEDYFRF